jgi:outer membrane protein assembly factor BamE (lipoprotein component of BamABCDE complex)
MDFTGAIPMSKLQSFVLFGLLSTLSLFMVGCNQLTRDRWDTIQVGSADRQEVETVLGQPTEKPMKDLWIYEKNEITAKFYFDDKDIVKAKKWINDKDFERVVEPKDWDDR